MKYRELTPTRFSLKINGIIKKIVILVVYIYSHVYKILL